MMGCPPSAAIPTEVTITLCLSAHYVDEPHAAIVERVLSRRSVARKLRKEYEAHGPR